MLKVFSFLTCGAIVLGISIKLICYGILAICGVIYGFEMPSILGVF